MPETMLLATKLHIPRSRRELVARPRLTGRLSAGLQHLPGVTLISAPPGFGKTTLLSEWINGQQAPKVAWVSLDERDNDPVRFWSYLIAALNTVQAGLGSDAMALLQAPQPPPIETTLTALINAITTIPEPFTLVLDDYHLIESEAIHAAMTFLLEHLPPQMHLIIISRADPPLPLTRLRVRNQLVELRESDLRFTPTEAAAFLKQIMGLDLSPDDITALEARTEGWIAGLQLAALSIQGRRNVQRFVQAFTGSHRYVIDYLAEEVLSRQPEHLQTFLLQTSILERLCGPLCDAVVGVSEAALFSASGDHSSPAQISSSQEILEELEAANLFIIPLDDERRWYRYHHLFADFLRQHLEKTVGQEEVMALHRRASDWYAGHHLYAEAVDHALAAGDPGQATQLIEQLALTMLTQGEVKTLQNWLEQLPEALVRPRPRLALAWAWAKVITNEWNEVEPLLQIAEQSLAQKGSETVEEGLNHADAGVRGMWGEVAAMRSMIFGNRGDVTQAIKLSHQALERLPQNNLVVRSVILMNLGLAYELAGDLARAGQTLREAISTAQASDNLVTVLSATHNLARLHEDGGQLHQAAEFFRQTIQLVETQADERGHPGRPLPVGAWAYLGLAEILREQNELETARGYATLGLDLSRQGNILGPRQIGHIILARVLQAQGDAAGALEAIQQAEQLARRSSPLGPWIGAIQARLWLAQGNLEPAVRWAATCDLPLDHDFKYAQLPGEYATLVRVFIAQNRFEAALELLARMHAVEKFTGRQGRLLEILMLQALVLYLQGEPAQALTPLAQAVAIAEPAGYVRLFVDEGPPMAALLRYGAACGLSPNYVAKLLAALGEQARPGDEEKGRPEQPSSAVTPGAAAPALVEPLSERELEVLHLVAAGLSNQEIADRLVIAVSTVKSHTHKIFAKLNAQNRTQAVARARELALL